MLIHFFYLLQQHFIENYEILLKLPFFSIYLGIQCVVKLLYAHRKGSFTGLAHLGSKWTVCGTPFETNSTSLQLSTTKMCNNLFIVCFHLHFFNLSFFSPPPGPLTSSRRVVISIYPLTYVHTRRGSHHCWHKPVNNSISHGYHLALPLS